MARLLRVLAALAALTPARAQSGNISVPVAQAPPGITTADGNLTLRVPADSDVFAQVGSESALPLVASMTDAQSRIVSLQSQLDAANLDRVAQVTALQTQLQSEQSELASQMTSQMASQMTSVTSSLTALSLSGAAALALTESKAEANRVGIEALATRTGYDLTAEVSISSSGYCGPHRVQLTIAGANVSYMGGRGLHLYVLNVAGSTVAIARQTVFDTNAHPGGSPGLVVVLNALPEGAIIAIGCYDECAYSKSSGLDDALEKFGSRFVRGLLFREAWAMIGIKGAPIGSVPEQDGGSLAQNRRPSAAVCTIGGRNLRNKGGGNNNNNQFIATTARATKNVFVGRLAKANLIEIKAFSDFNVGALANVRDNHRVTHSGKIYGGGRWPYCSSSDSRSDVSGYVKLATIHRGGSYRYIRVWVYGSHRGYNRGSYMEQEEYLIACGDKCSSFELRRRGNHRVRLWNSLRGATRSEFAGNGDVDIPQNDGFELMLRVDPYCGANLQYTYRVEVMSDHASAASDDSIVLDRHDCWNLQTNRQQPAPYKARFC